MTVWQAGGAYTLERRGLELVGELVAGLRLPIEGVGQGARHESVGPTRFGCCGWVSGRPIVDEDRRAAGTVEQLIARRARRLSNRRPDHGHERRFLNRSLRARRRFGVARRLVGGPQAHHGLCRPILVSGLGAAPAAPDEERPEHDERADGDAAPGKGPVAVDDRSRDRRARALAGNDGFGFTFGVDHGLLSTRGPRRDVRTTPGLVVLVR